MYRHRLLLTALGAAFLTILVGVPAGPQDRAEIFSKIEQLAAKQAERLELPGLSIAVVHGDEVMLAKGFGFADVETKREADADTIFPIGSVTKVFTGLLLLDLRDEGMLRLDDPVSKYLPQPALEFSKAEVGSPESLGAPEITLAHLTMHTSGLPGLPDNVVADGGDLYNHYSEKQLLDYLGRAKLEFPAGERSEYSNLGVGLLGYALSRAAGKPYEDLIASRILEPLAMNSSGFTFGDEIADRLATGYDESDPAKLAPVWNLGVLGPAGSMKSSANDLAKFLVYHIKGGIEATGEPLRTGSLLEARTPRIVDNKWKIAVGIGWHMIPSRNLGTIVWHNGMVAGGASWVGFLPNRRVGVVVLTNRAISVDSLGVKLLELAAPLATPPSVEPPAEVAAVVEKLCAGFSADVPDELAGEFSAEFLKAIPYSQVEMILKSIYAVRGKAVRVARYVKGEVPGSYRAFIEMESGAEVPVEVALDDTDPPKIVYLLFPPE